MHYLIDRTLAISIMSQIIRILSQTIESHYMWRRPISQTFSSIPRGERREEGSCLVEEPDAGAAAPPPEGWFDLSVALT